MPKTKKESAKSSAAAGESADAALALLRPRLLALDAVLVTQPRNDVRAAASFVLAEIVPKLADAGLKKRLHSLPAAEFDASAIGDLKPAALACLATQALLSASSVATVTVRLPTDLLSEATTVRARMLKVCAHQFDDDPQLSAEVAAIRAGSGYLDLAEDLLRLAALYKDHAASVALDGRYYDKHDVALAQSLASRISTELRHAQLGSDSRDLAWRAYAFLADRYEEVASTCRWLLRKADGEQQFPSLRTATGFGSRRGRTKDAAAPEPAPSSDNPAKDS